MIYGAQIGTRVRVLSDKKPRCSGYSSSISDGGKDEKRAIWNFSLGNTGTVTRVYKKPKIVLCYVRPDEEFGSGEHSFAPRDLERIEK